MKRQNKPEFEEIVSVFEKMMELENRFGIYVPIKELKKAVGKLKRKNKISEKKVDKSIQILMAEGVIFIPKKGYVLRVANTQEHFKMLEREKNKSKEETLDEQNKRMYVKGKDPLTMMKKLGW